jgi:uncharacterized protein YbjT (DUF2867 family)
VLPHFFDAGGVVRGPAGDGRVAAVARRDVVEVAVAALQDEAHAGQTYVLTGPEALTLDDVAEELSEATGDAKRYERETVEQATPRAPLRRRAVPAGRLGQHVHRHRGPARWPR